MATIQRVLATTQPQLGYGYKSVTHDYMNDSLLDVSAISAETFPILKPAKLSPEEVTIGDVFAKVPELYLHSVNYRHSIVENTSDINDVLNVKGSLAIKLSSVEGTLQGLYAKTSTKSTSSITFVLSCEVVTKIVKIDIKSLKMKPIPPKSKEADLYQQYGDSFVSEVRYGGSMFASVSVILEDTDNKDDIKASISGVLNASSVKGKLDGSLDKKNFELIKNKRVEVSFSLKGSVISGPVPNTMEEFLKAAQDFPLSVGLFAPPYVLFVTPYKLLDPSVGMDYSNVLTTVEEVLSSSFLRLTGVSAQLNELQQKMLDSPDVILTQKELKDFDGCLNETQACMSKISEFLVSFQSQAVIPDFSTLFEEVSKLQLQAKSLNRIFVKNYQLFAIHSNEFPPQYIDIVQSNLVLKTKKFSGSNQLWQFDTQGVVTNANNYAVLTVDKDNNVVAIVDLPSTEAPATWSVQDLALLHLGTNKYLTAKDGKFIVAEKSADAKQQWCLRSASVM